MSETTPEPSNSSNSSQKFLGRVKALATGDVPEIIGQGMRNSLRIILVLLVLCGGIFPLVVFGVGLVAFWHRMFI